MNPFEILEINPLKKMVVSKPRWYEFGSQNLIAMPFSLKPEVLGLVPNSKIQLNFMNVIMTSIGTGISDRALYVAKRNIVYKDFYSEVVNIDDAIQKAFASDMEVYNKEFFPNNKLEYSAAHVRDQEALTERFKTLTAKYVTELGIPAETLFANIALSYSAAIAVQQSATQAVTHNSNEYKKILDKYLDQLWKNMLVVGGAYADEPGAAKEYFKPQVLHARHKNRKGIIIDKPLKLVLKPSSITLADFVYLASDKIIMENTGKVSFYYFSTDVEIVNNVVPEDAIEVPEGAEVVVLGSTLKKFLYIVNKEIATNAKVELSLM